MTTPNTETQSPQEVTTGKREPEAAHKPRKSAEAKKPIRPKKSSNIPKRGKHMEAVEPLRPGSKASKVLALLHRTDGASLKELMKATGWQPHSVRGFLSATVAKKHGLTVTSIKDPSGERRYAVKL
jgi:hypothetical protein